MPTSPGATPGYQAQIRAEQIALRYRHLGPSLAINAAVATAVIDGFRSVVETGAGLEDLHLLTESGEEVAHAVAKKRVSVSAEAFHALRVSARPAIHGSQEAASRDDFLSAQAFLCRPLTEGSRW